MSKVRRDIISNIQLANFCWQVAKSENGVERLTEFPSVYMWGTYFNPLTEDLISRKAKQYPKNFSDARKHALCGLAKKNTSYIACDCAGLIKAALWTKGNPHKSPKYDAFTDLGTAGLWNIATERGHINSIPEEQGVIVYKQGHVGVYLGNGKVCECTYGSRGDGIVIHNISKGGWTYWLKVPMITYVKGNDAKPSVTNKILKFLKTGGLSK